MAEVWKRVQHAGIVSTASYTKPGHAWACRLETKRLTVDCSEDNWCTASGLIADVSSRLGYLDQSWILQAQKVDKLYVDTCCVLYSL